MNKFKNNFAYIDGNNLYRGIKDSGWKLDFYRFRKWLEDKYQVSRAYYFIGLLPREKELYIFLQKAGFTLVFKEVVYNSSSGCPKGNCDADLVLQSVVDVFENNCEKQILVTSDGDYSSLVRFLLEKNKLRSVLSPRDKNKCSILLKRTNSPIVFLNEIKDKIAYKEKTPIKDIP